MLRDEVIALARAARAAVGTTAHRAALLEIEERLEEPLRVAIVGRVKAGKSTLLNALVGERLAATDFSECTRIVTWYRDGVAHGVEADLATGQRVQLGALRRGNHLDIDLGGRAASDIGRLIVTRPSQVLRRMTLIDTPGLGSTSDALGARTSAEFAPVAGDDSSAADAVIYLLRHVHEDDVGFLESFRGPGGPLGNPVNSIGVLSRSDEIGGASDRFMKEASATAGRLARHPQLRTLVHDVVPVAGLLAETAVSLTQAEFQELAVVARLPATELDALCLSVDRFLNRSPDLALDPEVRRSMLDRFGLFGLRIAATAIAKHAASDSQQLSELLLRASRLDDLVDVIRRVFESRAGVLKNASALVAVHRILLGTGDDHHALLARGEALLEAPEFRELGLLATLRRLEASGARDGPVALASLQRVLGGDGSDPAQRLGLTPDATSTELTTAAASVLGELRRARNDPRLRGVMREVLDGAVAACESIVTRTGDSR